MNKYFTFLMPFLISANLFAAPTNQDLDSVQRLETSDAKTTRIYLVRHGESAFNQPDANGIKYTSGKSLNVPLTDKGKEQAVTLGKKLNTLFPQGTPLVITSSNAKRAQDTASALQEQLNYATRSDHDYDGFNELGQGNWEGKPKDEDYETDMQKWENLSAKDKFIQPKVSTGESYTDVANRYLASLQQTVNDYPNKTIVVTSHTAAMNALYLKLSGLEDSFSKDPATPLPMLGIENCDMLLLELPAGKTIDQAKVVKHYHSNLTPSKY